jgi:hypothetical protein
LITVPVPAGARELTVRYDDRVYSRGRLVTMISLLIVALAFVLPVVFRRR